MKRVLTILSFVTIAGLSSAFAIGVPKVSPGALAEFQKEFPAAKNVKWSKEEDYFKVVFLYEDIRTIAYYTEEGEFAGSMRNMSYEELPLNVVHQVNSRFGNIIPLEATEITNGDGAYYRIVFELGGKRYTINATSTGGIGVLKKQKISA
jgi:hypothetical protein